MAVDRFASGRASLVAAILERPGVTAAEDRRAAHDAAPGAAATKGYLDKVRKHAHRVVDEDVAAMRAAGLDDAAIFELTVAAAVGQAGRQYAAAIAALDAVEDA
jgi:alkylhydroperoxidase family enzyme